MNDEKGRGLLDPNKQNDIELVDLKDSQTEVNGEN
jgi:hypothetical protein